ncbi:sigma-70 family RNA polymerase sigma factor [Aestuariivirga sp.]|uniref:sigma-70 family RNA polymerase sigma factor n=1 Tax=Aestuariivirga sp. TaxID=2650926 RepID=UPI0025BDC192|nr:sigma-70 family RNA polymerase sigma factor [Aestuariivirga sp.]
MYAVMELADRRKDEEKQRLETLFRSLITRVAQNRDRQAFAQLFDHFAPRLKSFMMRKNTSAELAEDLVQEAMIAVWTKAALYEPTKGSVTTWVFTIARNLRIDRVRRDVHMPTTELGDYDEPSEAPEGEELLGRKQEDGLVARALQAIPEEQRQILVLSFVEELPQSEIASKLAIPLGTVKSRMRLAYGHLRRILETGL